MSTPLPLPAASRIQNSAQTLVPRVMGSSAVVAKRLGSRSKTNWVGRNPDVVRIGMGHVRSPHALYTPTLRSLRTQFGTESTDSIFKECVLDVDATEAAMVKQRARMSMTGNNDQPSENDIATDPFRAIVFQKPVTPCMHAKALRGAIRIGSARLSRRPRNAASVAHP